MQGQKQEKDEGHTNHVCTWRRISTQMGGTGIHTQGFPGIPWEAQLGITTIFGSNFLEKFGFTINYDDNIPQSLDYITPLKDPNEFFNNNMFIDLNGKLCQSEEHNMFDWKILNNYVSCILDAKYDQVDTNKVAVKQTIRYEQTS